MPFGGGRLGLLPRLDTGIVVGPPCRIEIPGLDLGGERQQLARVARAMVAGAQRDLRRVAEIRIGKGLDGRRGLCRLMRGLCGQRGGSRESRRQELSAIHLSLPRSLTRGRAGLFHVFELHLFSRVFGRGPGPGHHA